MLVHITTVFWKDWTSNGCINVYCFPTRKIIGFTHCLISQQHLFTHCTSYKILFVLRDLHLRVWTLELMITLRSVLGENLWYAVRPPYKRVPPQQVVYTPRGGAFVRPPYQKVSLVVETWELIKSQRHGAVNVNLSLSQ